MEDKKKENRILKIGMILLIIIIIIIAGIILILKHNSKNNTQELVEEIDNTGKINIINTTDTVEAFTTNTAKDKNYVQMTSENYKQYNNSKQSFRIQNVTDNKNGTFTIRGRVYEYLEIPSTLSKDECQALEDGKALDILGEKVTKVEDESRAKYAGYDIALKTEDNMIVYYVKMNNDGSGKLADGSESALAKGTDVYMYITLEENFAGNYGGKYVTLKEHYGKGLNIEDKNTIRLPLINDEFAFLRGQCENIFFSTL